MTMTTNPTGLPGAPSLPPGRTVEEQQAINREIMERCTENGNETGYIAPDEVQCVQEAGFIPVNYTPPSAAEGNIIALICVVLGLVGAFVSLWTARAVYRFITR
jgi:hypothetical protein